MRDALGSGYTDAVRAAHTDVPDSADFVMFWWNKAAHILRAGKAARFGFIATNSLRQTFNRRVLEQHLDADDGLCLRYAIPDHPWVDSADGAAVRISMTVAERGNADGRLLDVTEEHDGNEDAAEVTLVESVGHIHADLTVGANVAAVVPLLANQGITNTGVKLHGAGFIVTHEEAAALGLGRIADLERHIRHYRHGRDLAQTSRDVMVIDLDGLSAEEVRTRFPEVFQWVFTRVKPERDQNNEKYRRDVWSLATGGRLGVGNDPRYNKTRCFETFPFPTATEAQHTRIRDLAERLDAHRKRQQAQHPKLTFTDLYNVLEKLRAGTPLNAKEHLTHEHGLVTVLRQLHDDLNAAVAGAYALPPTATDEAILTHLCALNAQRAAEERTGQIRHLRPAFQNPTSTATQTTLSTGEGELPPTPAKPTAKFAWPETLAEQAQAVRAALNSLAAPSDAMLVASQFKSAPRERIADLLATLASLGQARTLADGRFVAA